MEDVQNIFIMIANIFLKICPVPYRIAILSHQSTLNKHIWPTMAWQNCARKTYPMHLRSASKSPAPRRNEMIEPQGRFTVHFSGHCIMDASILFHAQRATLGKKTKFNSLMVDWHSCFHLPQGCSTQLQMWHHVSLILDTNCQKLIWNIFIISIHGLVYFHQNTKEVLKNSQKMKMQKPSNNINNSFWSALYSSLLMISMLKSYPSHVLFFLVIWWMVYGPPFHQLIPLV